MRPGGSRSMDPPAGKYSLYFCTDMNRRDWVHVKDVEITGKPADLGELKAEGTDC